ncbi:hypothetical protein N657DRAFT_631097 [Parathielavia appendiculata]|uniref:Tyrosinase copper-binding domain-containing protein n=1 Tax=Parathielavia appendiculata TaxID=2587402 RepID=A0AAN6U6N0_9PEZI|nr:hypothetical protein N657DRAFT_631097 [Parathielavia appendiculata]
MLSIAEDLTSHVYDIFARIETLDDSSWRVSSLEFPHILVHALSVCNGTMPDLNWSAFDPLLQKCSMLHHSNVDRLIAMWQVIHYQEAMFNFTAKSTGQYATLANSPVTADTSFPVFGSAKRWPVSVRPHHT